MLRRQKRPPLKPSVQRPLGVSLYPLPPARPQGLQMHRPRQGCASLESTETPLCSGSWSPDALIETLRPCRNQREGKGELGRGCKHIWHLQKTLHTTTKCIEKQSSVCPLQGTEEDSNPPPTHTHLVSSTSRKVIM